MRVFGIDPGSTNTGYAVVERRGGRYGLITAGVVHTRASDPMPERLKRIFDALIAEA